MKLHLGVLLLVVKLCKSCAVVLIKNREIENTKYKIQKIGYNW